MDVYRNNILKCFIQINISYLHHCMITDFLFKLILVIFIVFFLEILNFLSFLINIFITLFTNYF